MQCFGHYVRPGTWDDDLDNFQEPLYEENVGEGYNIRLVRARDLTWNAYVVLPEGHWAIGKHYDFFGNYAPQGLGRPPPQNLTYGGPGAEHRVYGFYLTGIVKPREDYAQYHDPHKFFSVHQTGETYLDDGNLHVTYGKMRKLCMELVAYFKTVEDPETAKAKASLTRAPQGMNKLKAVHKLWLASRPAAFFVMNGIPGPAWDETTAQRDIDALEYIDYLLGRLIKCRFKDFPVIDASGYDNDYGTGAAQRALDTKEDA